MNIEKMTLSQLKDFLSKVEREIPRAKAREAAEFRAQVNELLEARGLKISDVLPPHSAVRVGVKPRVVPVKYRDPKTGAEWSGRGRKPHWYDAKHAKRFEVAA